MDMVPDAGQLAQVMSHAMAPAFVLGAAAAFVAILLSRIASVLERVRYLHEIADDDPVRGHLKADIPRLRQRARLLNSATYLVIWSGICTSLLMVLGFAAAFLRLRHEYGAALLFAASIGLLAMALYKFGQEVRMGLSESDHFR
ncbi:MAG TPA: DUF2721 domain-containing protein [Acetobacteraceae bacterium]|nr:DUF2721 domain-containing protein [Acetobacteraceae bacterium]